jgi:hypothetical protein
MRLKRAVIPTLVIGLTLSFFCDHSHAQDPGVSLVRVVIHDESDLEGLKEVDARVYARLDEGDEAVLLAGVDALQTESLVARGLDADILDPDMTGKRYYVVYRFPRLPGSGPAAYGSVLHEAETLFIMRMSPGQAEKLADAGAEIRAVTTDPKPIEGTVELGIAPRMPQAPTAVTPDLRIEAMIAQVDSAKVYEYTGDLSGEWPVTIGGSPYTIATRHTYSGEPIRKATEYVGRHLEDLGLTVEYHEWGDSTYPNVIGELPGQGSPDSIVIICAHVDDMPSGPTAPGADDNASGTTAVLVAADIMTKYDWHYTVRFALWTGEEQGLWGSHYYALRCYNLGEPIVGVLNLDMIAYNTVGSSWDIDLHAKQSMPETLDLAQLFADVVNAYGLDLICQIVPNGTGASDHASFWDYGYTSILGIEDFGDFNPYYHTTSDLLSNCDMSYYVEFVRASLAATAHMAGVLGPAEALPSTTLPVSLVLAAALAILALKRAA